MVRPERMKSTLAGTSPVDSPPSENDAPPSAPATLPAQKNPVPTVDDSKCKRSYYLSPPLSTISSTPRRRCPRLRERPEAHRISSTLRSRSTLSRCDFGSTTANRFRSVQACLREDRGFDDRSIAEPLLLLQLQVLVCVSSSWAVRTKQLATAVTSHIKSVRCRCSTGTLPPIRRNDPWIDRFPVS